MADACPACEDDAFIAKTFPTLNFDGCQSIKLRVVPVEQLCEGHRLIRTRIDQGARSPIDRLVDGYPLRWKIGPGRGPT
jgi:hypothetical protein